MRILLSLLLLTLIACTPAAAAERVLLLPAVPGATAGTAAMVDGLRREAVAKGTVRVIVGLRVPFAPEPQLSTAEAAQQRAEITATATGLKARLSAAVARNPGSVRSYTSIPFMALDVTAAELDRLRADPQVISLYADQRFRLNATGGYHLKDRQSNSLVRAPQAWAAGFTGLGQTIAIIDTGVDKTHPFLAGKVVSEACYSNAYCPGGLSVSTASGSGMPCADPACDHGTHVAGIAAGRGTAFSGVARDATIIAIQVFSAPDQPGAEPLSRYSDILAGLERIYELRNSFKIAAVNMSLGGNRFYSSCDSAFPPGAAIIDTLRSAGIATVASSGNEYYTDSMVAPACFSSAVSVGAVSAGPWWGDCGNVTTADKVACFSNTASFLSLLAPGALISSSVPGGGFALMAGTSQAAPHVAGAFAVLRQNMPKASVSQILARLQNTGRKIADYRVPAIVKPRIDVAAALVMRQVALSYARLGSGSGVVTITTPKGKTDCSASCKITTAAQSKVSATAKAAPGSRFTGWRGPCKGVGACRFTLSDATSLSATFVPEVTLTYERRGQGRGSVSFAPAGGQATCTANCVQRYGQGSTVRLTATPGPKAAFMGWSGACSGQGVCSITMSSSVTVIARFARK